jgi:hypothetical protein
VAVAALAALWGHWFATRDTSAAESPGRSVTAAGAGAIAAGGDISGYASTGGRRSAPRRAHRPRGATDAGVRPGRVIASGTNSIAAGGDISGSASTGDDSKSSCP